MCCVQMFWLDYDYYEFILLLCIQPKISAKTNAKGRKTQKADIWLFERTGNVPRSHQERPKINLKAKQERLRNALGL